MKLLLASSSGGHLYETYLLKDWWKNHQRLWVTPKNKMSQSLLKNEKIIFSAAPDQRSNLINLTKNSILAIKVLTQEKPDTIFSTGSGIALPFFFLAKILKIKTIFMETFIFIKQPTLTGRIIYFFKVADVFLVQNKKLLEYYPQAKHWGSVL